jgi:hypothetical protein
MGSADMSYEFQNGDYIEFKRIVHAEQSVRHATDYATGRPKVVPASPEQILPQAGNAQILRIIKEPRRVKTPSGVVEVQTARAAAGAPLGTVTVVLDDAILVAKQQGLFDMAVEQSAESMYGVDAKGHA